MSGRSIRCTTRTLIALAASLASLAIFISSPRAETVSLRCVSTDKTDASLIFLNIDLSNRTLAMKLNTFPWETYKNILVSQTSITSVEKSFTGPRFQFDRTTGLFEVGIAMFQCGKMPEKLL